jgi:hypothetical protein
MRLFSWYSFSGIKEISISWIALDCEIINFSQSSNEEVLLLNLIYVILNGKIKNNASSFIS